MKAFIGRGNRLFSSVSIIVAAFLLVMGIAIGVIANSSLTYALDTNSLTYGDLDCDGKVTSADAVILARAANGIIKLSPNQKLVADLNQDGKVNKKDVDIIAKYMVNYDIMSLPYTEPIVEIKYGDIDLDGSVSSADAVLLARHLEGIKELTDEQKVNADLNLDSKIDNCDADLLAKYLTNQIELPYIVMATPGNATPGNATPGNATPGNATPGNAALNDNVMKLLELGFNNNDVIPGEKVELKLSTRGACRKSMRLYFTSYDNGYSYSFSVDVESLNDNPYFIVPKNIPSGEYFVVDLLIVGLNSDNSTFTVHHSAIDSSADFFSDFVGTDETLIVTASVDDNDISVGDVSLSASAAKIGEQVKVSIENKERLFALALLFKSDNGNEFKIHLNRFDIKYEGSYFVIPSNVVPDKYYVYQMEVSNDEKTSIYTREKNLQKDIFLEVLQNKEKTYTYDNVNLGEDVINEIKNAPDDINVVINASLNSIISESIFNAIKGTNKKLVIVYRGDEIIFNGKDIKEVKTIDVSINIDYDFETADKDEKLSSMVEDGIVINLSSNGNLPGKAKYKIYADDTLKELVGTKNIYLYYYDEDNNMFSLIQNDIKLNGDYFEFEIEHNSKYILTKNKIDSQYVIKIGNNIVHFQNGDVINYLLIAGGIGLIAITLIIILLVKRKK